MKRRTASRSSRVMASGSSTKKMVLPVRGHGPRARPVEAARAVVVLAAAQPPPRPQRGLRTPASSVQVLHGAVAAPQPAPAPALPRPGVLAHGDGRPEVILLSGVGAVLPLAGLGPPEAEAGVVARVGGLGAGVAVRVPATRLLSPGRPHRLQ